MNNSALSGAAVIDFNSEAQGASSTWTFNNSVTFSSVNDLMVQEVMYDDGIETFSDVAFGELGYLDNIRIDFADEGVTAFGFNLFYADPEWQISLYSNESGLLGTLDLMESQCSYDVYTAFTTDKKDIINYAILSARGESDFCYGMILDNFTYVSQTAAVPEPATFMLIGAGLGLIGLAGLKRKIKK